MKKKLFFSVTLLCFCIGILGYGELSAAPSSSKQQTASKTRAAKRSIPCDVRSPEYRAMKASRRRRSQIPSQLRHFRPIRQKHILQGLQQNKKHNNINLNQQRKITPLTSLDKERYLAAKSKYFHELAKLRVVYKNNPHQLDLARRRLKQQLLNKKFSQK